MAIPRGIRREPRAPTRRRLRRLVSCAVVWLLAASPLAVCGAGELFEVDVAKENEAIEHDLAEAKASLAQNLLQKVRASLRLAQDRLARIRKERCR